MLTLLGLIVFFIFIAVRSSAPSMTMLYGELSAADSTAIAAQLDLARIPYKISTNGQEVMVPHQQIGKARMLLAQEGLPNNGTIGYEIFDQKQKFGQTSFVQNINQLRALEGELARTIRTLDSVRNARVHLVLPQRELFTRESRPASASVIVNLRGSQQISGEQASAIQHLVASAVPRLKPENVALTDGNANLLAGGGKNSTFGGTAGGSEVLKLKFEQREVSKLEEMISGIVGYGKVRVNVSADLDFDVVSRNSETYDPEGQVVRSTQSISEDEKDGSGSNTQTVTVQNNLPGLPDSGGAGAGGGSSSNRTEEITNYEISRTVEQVVSESGEVRKLSVAVLVDGYYEETPIEDPETEEGDELEIERVYRPRTQEELDKIADLVKASIGFDETRGDTVEVVNMQFANGTDISDLGADELLFGTFERQELLQFAETFMLSIVALLVVLLVLRPLVNHVAAASQAVSEHKSQEMEDNIALLASQVEGQPQLAPPVPGELPAGEGGEPEESMSVANVEGRVSASSVKKVSDLVDNHPSEAVAVIRSWMSQES